MTGNGARNGGQGGHIHDMARLTVVRHGQASYLAKNYDELSPLGRRQARLLGEYWVRMGARFERVFTGPRVRQKDTAAIVGEVLHEAGREWPAPVVLEELDEFPAEPVVRNFTPQLAERHEHIRQWVEDFETASEAAGKERFRAGVAEAWQRYVMATEGMIEALRPGTFSWQEKTKRVDPLTTSCATPLSPA